MQIVAFGHESRVGKDTSAKFLDTALRLEGLRVRKVSFAAKLKEIAFITYGWAGLKPGIFYESDAGAKERNVVISKIGKTPVEIWIEIGNKFREIYEDTWIDLVLNTDYPKVDVLIITDLRFPNEAGKVQGLQGVCVKIQNERVEKRNSVSDRALDGWNGWDEIIINEFDLGMLNSAIDLLAQTIIDRHNAR